MNLANEGLEARKKDEEVAQRKRKAEDDKTWEGTTNSIAICGNFSSFVNRIRQPRTTSRQLAQFCKLEQEEEEDQDCYPWMIPFNIRCTINQFAHKDIGSSSPKIQDMYSAFYHDYVCINIPSLDSASRHPITIGYMHIC